METSRRISRSFARRLMIRGMIFWASSPKLNMHSDRQTGDNCSTEGMVDLVSLARPKRGCTSDKTDNWLWNCKVGKEVDEEEEEVEDDDDDEGRRRRPRRIAHFPKMTFAE